MNDQIRMEREDWISRFFGFLGSFQYVRQKRPISYPFSLYDKSVSEMITDDERKAGKVVDNIVYIYGVPEIGKTTYRSMLMDELPSDLYECITVDFGKMNQGLSNDDFCKTFSEFWAGNQELSCEFPCTKLSYGEEKVGKSVYVDVLCDTAQALYQLEKGEWPDKMNAVRYFAQAGKKLLDLGDESLTKAETAVYEDLKAQMREAAKQKKCIDISPSKEDPYVYLKLDFNANLRRYTGKKKAKRVVCFVDSFERYAAVSGKDMVTIRNEYHPFLEFMASVPDVIWVVFGPKRPGEAIRKYVPAENCWCMKGARRESVLKYLDAMCPTATDRWKQEVYKRTAGYIPLLQYCIEKLERFPLEEVNWDEIRRMAEQLNISMEKLLELQGTGTKKPKDLDLWFSCLWEANWSAWAGEKYILPDEMEEEEKKQYLVQDVLGKLFAEEYAHAVSDITAEHAFFLPTLAYLVKKSSENVGTLHQFSWRRKGKFAELNKTGQSYVDSISNTTPFCLEFIEYPEPLYLDPVFIAIMQQNAHYEEWCALFDENCCVKASERAANDGSLESVERAKDTAQDVGETKRKTNKVSADIIADEHASVDDTVYETFDVSEKEEKTTEEETEDAQQGDMTPQQAAEVSKHVNDSHKVDDSGVDRSKSQGKGTTPERNPYVYTLADDAWKDIVWGEKALPNNPPDK